MNKYEREMLEGSTPDKVRFIWQSANRPLTRKQKQYLWECEPERKVFKSCLRKVSTLERKKEHTSWNTAHVANLQLT